MLWLWCDLFSDLEAGCLFLATGALRPRSVTGKFRYTPDDDSTKTIRFSGGYRTPSARKTPSTLSSKRTQSPVCWEIPAPGGCTVTLPLHLCYTRGPQNGLLDGQVDIAVIANRRGDVGVAGQPLQDLGRHPRCVSADKAA